VKRAVSLGSGEIVLNSIDADGTKAGFDLVITRRISESVGVPVVARLGHGSASRIAAGVLSSIGLNDWIGDDAAAYTDIAVKFAAMPAHLTALRSELPARVAASAAGNPSVYTRSVEDAYRGFWKRYCESSESESASPQR